MLLALLKKKTRSLMHSTSTFLGIMYTCLEKWWLSLVFVFFIISKNYTNEKNLVTQRISEQ